ncbi:MAG: histidine phosphatase family protein [Mycobacteriaceae bacterium]
MSEFVVPPGSLILARHGQTASNVEHRLDSRPPGAPLTELGHEQAQTLAHVYGAVDLSAVVSSVAVRARQTAAPVGAAAKTDVQVREGLQETDAGALEDRADREAHEEFIRVYGAWHAGDLRERIPQGESGQDVLDRFLPVVEELREEYLNDRLRSALLVSHGAAIRLVAAHLAGVHGAFAATYHLPNTATIILQPTPEGWRCVRWGQYMPPFLPPAQPHVEAPA